MTATVSRLPGAAYRLDPRSGWRLEHAGSDVVEDDVSGDLRLAGRTAAAVPAAEPSGSFAGRTMPTGVAAGPAGRLVVTDPDGDRLLTYTTYEARLHPLWPPRGGGPPDPYALTGPRGVAFGPGGDLVVTDTGGGRVLVYAWPSLATRTVVELPGGTPWDVAHDSTGRAYVADAAAGRVHRFDRLWRRDAGYVGGHGLLRRPRHLAVDDEDRLHVVDADLSGVVVLDGRGRPLPGQETPEGRAATVRALHRRAFPPPLRLDAAGLWLPQQRRPDCPALFLSGLTVDRRGRADVPGQSAPGPVLLPRPSGPAFTQAGRFVSQPLDGGAAGVVWHRVVLDADVPRDTALVLRTFTAPAPLGGTEVAGLADERWSPPLGVGPDGHPEGLVLSPPGRYLWLRLDLRGNGQASPLVRAASVYAPRRSSLALLPPVFQEDPVSADFLDRFLSYFDTVFAEVETRIDDFAGHLDPDGVPGGGFLTWLGEWLDVVFLSEWPDATRREFVRRAIELYRMRGTVAGLRAVLQVHAAFPEPLPAVIEHFRVRDFAERRLTPEPDLVDGRVWLAGIPVETADGSGTAHRFTVVVPRAAAPDRPAVAAVHRLIQAQKPAHTAYDLRVLDPGLRIGCQSTVGIDTLLGSYPAEPLGDTTLGRDTRLADPPSGGVALGRTRLGSAPRPAGDRPRHSIRPRTDEKGHPR
jgi:phage tail-like protein